MLFAQGSSPNNHKESGVQYAAFSRQPVQGLTSSVFPRKGYPQKEATGPHPELPKGGSSTKVCAKISPLFVPQTQKITI